MLERRIFDLMSLLQNEHYQTADFLAHQLKVEEKTVRNLIRESNVILEKNGAFIESKYGAGYRLIIKNSGQFESFLNLNQFLLSDNSCEVNSEELKEKGYDITWQELHEEVIFKS